MPDAQSKFIDATNAKYVLETKMFVQLRKDSPVYGPLLGSRTILSAAGDVVRHDWATEGEQSLDAMTFVSALHPFFLAMSFCNCRNISSTDDKPDRKLVEARSKKGRRTFTFKTLGIDPMRAVLRKAAQSINASNDLKRALHICRGHFANYDAKLLFGKHKGTFWIPQHIRGNVESGAVGKDYAVKAK